MPKASRVAQRCNDMEKLSFSMVVDFSRLRSLVLLIPVDDPDRRDLLKLLELEEQHRRTIKHLEEDIFDLLRQEDSYRRELLQRDTEFDLLGEERRQLSGALELSRYIVNVSRRKIEEQRISVGWLCRRLKRGEKLQAYEKQEIQSLITDSRLQEDLK